MVKFRPHEGGLGVGDNARKMAREEFTPRIRPKIDSLDIASMAGGHMEPKFASWGLGFEMKLC
jgi:hypothetical protein